MAGPPVQVSTATLTDRSSPLPDGRVAWATTWRACFTPAPEDGRAVSRWEAQPVTQEGTSPRIRPLPGDGCVQLEVATGTDAPAAGMPGREIQLSDAQGLAYRVRAVHPDGTVTPWTEPVRVGRVSRTG